MDLHALFDATQNKRHSGTDDEGAIAAYTDIQEKAKIAGDLLLAADCLHMIGIVQYHQAGVLKDEGKEDEAKTKFAQADETYQQAIEQFRQIDTSDGKMRVGAVLRDRGIIATKLGDLDNAEKYIRESIQILEELGQMDHLGMTEARLALALAERGNLVEAEKVAREAIERLDATDNWYFRSNARRDLASILIKMGKKPEALEVIDAAEKLLDAHPDRNTDVDHETLNKLRTATLKS